MFNRAPLPLSLRYSPSLLPNNLTCSGMGERGFRLCYVHKDELVLVESRNGSGFERTNKFTVCLNTQVFSATYVVIDSGSDASQSSSSSPKPTSEYLVVCSSQGVQLWSVDGERMEWFHQMNDLVEDGVLSSETRQLHFMRGSCGLVSSMGVGCVAVGSSLGTLYVLNVSGDVLHRMSTQSAAAVTAVAASRQFLFCANDDGDLLGYRIHSSFDTAMRIPGRGDACTTLACKGNVVIAGFSTGHIRIYRAEIGELAIELAAHSRPITALSLHPSSAYVASVGEDQQLNVWTCPDFLTPSGSDIDLGYSCRLEHSLCTGVAWAPDGRLLVGVYDVDEIAVYIASER